MYIPVSMLVAVAVLFVLGLAAWRLTLPGSPSGQLGPWIAAIIWMAVGGIVTFFVTTTPYGNTFAKNVGIKEEVYRRPSAPLGKVQKTGPDSYHLDPLPEGQEWVLAHEGSAEKGKIVDRSQEKYTIPADENPPAVNFWIRDNNGVYSDPVPLPGRP